MQKDTMIMEKRISFSVSGTDHSQIKAWAALHGVSIKTLILTMLNRELENEQIEKVKEVP